MSVSICGVRPVPDLAPSKAQTGLTAQVSRTQRLRGHFQAEGMTRTFVISS